MASNSVEDQSPDIAGTKPRQMTVNEYADLVGKWQMAYYTWQTSSITYHKYGRVAFEGRSSFAVVFQYDDDEFLSTIRPTNPCADQC